MPSAATYRSRFGSLSRAYKMIGYRTGRDHERIALNKRLRALHPEIIERTAAAIADVGGRVQRDPKTDLLRINDELVVSLVLARCQPDYYLLSWLDLPRQEIRFCNRTSIAFEAFRFEGLGFLRHGRARGDPALMGMAQNQRNQKGDRTMNINEKQEAGR